MTDNDEKEADMSDNTTDATAADESEHHSEGDRADRAALVDVAALSLEYARKVEAGTASVGDISTLVCHLAYLTGALPDALNVPPSDLYKARYCTRCGVEVVGKPVEVNSPDPQMVLCRSCSKPTKAAPTGRTGGPMPEPADEHRPLERCPSCTAPMMNGRHVGNCEDASCLVCCHHGEAAPYGRTADTASEPES